MTTGVVARVTHVAGAVGAVALLGAGATTSSFLAIVVPAAVGAAMGLMGQAFWCAVAFCIALFARLGEVVPELDALALPRALAIAAVTAFGLERLFDADARVVRSSFHLPMGALVVAALLAAVLGDFPEHSVPHFSDVFLKIVLLYALLVHVVDSPRRVVQLQVAMSLTVAAMALYSIAARLDGTIVVEGSRAAYVGALGDPNDFALVIFLYLPFVLEAALASSGATRAAFVVLSLVLAAGMTATQSRGSFIGAGVALAVALHVRSGRSLLGRARATVIALGLAAVLAVASGAGQRISGALGGSGIDESAQGRLDAWEAGTRMLMRHPAFGVGFGTFSLSYETYVTNPVIWGQREAHSSYFKVAGETGFAGLVPFAVLIVLALRTSSRLTRDASGRDGLANAAARATLPTVAGFCVMAAFLSQTWGWYFYVLFAQVAAQGCIAGVDELARAAADHAASTDLRREIA